MEAATAKRARLEKRAKKRAAWARREAEARRERAAREAVAERVMERVCSMMLKGMLKAEMDVIAQEILDASAPARPPVVDRQHQSSIMRAQPGPSG